MAKDSWTTRVGVILAVTGSAVGLGNFLRFPGEAVKHGGGVFLIPYLVAFLIVGIPLAWVEWSLGRYGGTRGHHSAPGIFRSLFRHRSGSYVGILGTLMPVMIYTYYVFVEAWCLAYAWDFLTGRMASLGGSGEEVQAHFFGLVGATDHGSVFAAGGGRILPFVAICFVLNFALIYRGVAKGIEVFCNIAMPLLVVCAGVVLVRVLTLGTPDPDLPEQSVINGLGYMWNPVQPGTTIWATLGSPDAWLAATGQVFFSLSVGFGLILTYASYLKEKDDVALSSLTACAGDGFSAVVLGGMIAIPAAFVFLGPAVVEDPPGTFGMGFIALPQVFNLMPLGQFFGFLFFFLLFLAAVTSSLSMLQPSIAFLEEALGIGRKPSVAILGFITLAGSMFVIWFSRGFGALDTIDWWMANFFIFIMATLQIIYFGWILGVGEGMKELARGAEIRLPAFLPFVLKYVSPTFLLLVFGYWAYREIGGTEDKPGRFAQLLSLPEEGPPVVQLSVGLIALVAAFFAFVAAAGNRRWDRAAIKETTP